MTARSLLLPVVGLVLPMFLCGCPAAGPSDGTPSDLIPGTSSEIFTKDPVEQHVVEARVVNEDGTEHVRPVPNNQIMVMFVADVTAADAAATLAQMQSDQASAGLALVGQIPDLGIYQLEIVNDETDPAAAMARLDGVMDMLGGYPGVETVGYNELLTDRAVENDDDNSAITQYDRCPFAVIDYYQAIPLFDRVMPHVGLNDVTVAVIDSGLWVDSHQFDEIMPRTQFVGQQAAGSTPYDWHLHKHGTNIAGLIAADNHDGLFNGVALRVLGERLHLIVGEAYIWGNHYSLARAIARSREAVLLGADIVNLSLGTYAPNGRPNWLLTAQAEFARLFNESPDVLFIAAAGNENYELVGNDAPAGMPQPNVLTVGGHQSCNPDQRYAQSCTGSRIELSGPATSIPGLVGDNVVGPARYLLDGNSFAAPLVAAIAAIVQSIAPDLTGAQLKQFLLSEDRTWPAPEAVGGKRLAMIKTISSALLTRGAAAGDVNTILDAFGPADDIPDPSGYSVNRLCGEINFTVTGPSHNATTELTGTQITWNTGQNNYGIIGMGHQVILNVGASAGADMVQVSTTDGFRLNEPYNALFMIVAETPDGRQSAGIDGRSGTFTLTECELTTRSLPLDWYSPANPGPHQLVFVEVSGSFSGTNMGSMRLSDGKLTHGVTYSAGGEFTTAFLLLDPEADTMEYLERHCTGGYLLGADE